MFTRASLRTKLSLAIGLLLTVSLGLMSVLAVVGSRQSLRAAIVAANLATAQLAGRAVEQYVADAVGIMQEAPGRPKLSQEIRDQNWPEVARVLENFRHHFTQFDYAFVQDPQGIIRVRVPPAETTGQDFSFRDFFQEVMRTRRLYVSGVYASKANQRPVVAIAVPVLNSAGTVSGVLVGALSPGTMSRFVSTIRQEDGNSVYVVDARGLLVAHSGGLGADALVDLSTEPVVRAVLTRRSGTMEFSRASGEAFLAAYVPIPALGWGVVAATPVSIVYAPTDRLGRWLLGVTLLFMGSAIGLGWALARTLTGPLQRISAATEQLATGDLSARTGVRYHAGELGRLAHAFDDMAASLERQKAETQRADASLRESEARNAATLETALDCIVTIDHRGHITEFNRAAERTFGHQRAEVLGREMAALLIPPALRDRHRDGLARYLATGHGPVIGQRLEMTALRADGTEFPVELAITRLPSDGPPMFTGFLRDITHQKRAEEALRESEASFRLLFSSNPLPMWVYDVATMYFLEVNDAATVQYGYSRDEFLRMRISDIRPPEDLPRLRETMTGLADGPEQAVRRHAAPWRHRLKDGRVRDVDIVAHSIDFSGRRAALVVAIDVTELKQTQEALAKYTERLSILHEIDRAIIAAQPPVAIAEAVLRRLRELLGVPRAIVNMFDFAAGEAEWLAAAGRRRIHLGPGVRFPLALMGDVEALRRGERQVIDVASLPRSTEAEALLASGVHVYMVVPMIAGGELIGGLSFGGASAQFPPEQVSIAEEAATQLAIGITQARLYERVTRQAEELEQQVRERTRELSAANEQLEQEIGERRRAEADADRANRLKSQFLANMSHELRTPLNAIIGFAELLHDAKVGPVTAEQKDFLADILTSSRHLLQLINDVLDLAKVESGIVEFHPEPVDLARLVDEVRDVVRGVAARKRIRLETAIDPAIGPVVLDPAKLKQVLYNYLSNAVKFTPEEGRVILRAAPEGTDAVRLEVEDTGIGIRAEDLGRLFAEFQQLDAGRAKRHEGTGLGLALTKRLVEAQGGRVGVRSTPGQGSVFFAVLPRAARPALVQPAVPAPPVRATRPGAPTILVIEDEAPDRAWLERVLTEAGYAVEAAASGAEAVARARGRAFDAITLDLLLPDTTPHDLMATIRAEGPNRDTPVVVVTVVAEREAAAGFVVQDFLTKPVRPEDLLTSLARAGVTPDAARTILVVDDDPGTRRLAEAALTGAGYRVVCAASGAAGLQAVEAESPAAVVLDLIMPEMDGFEFLAHYRGTREGRRVPVIVWTAKDLTVEDRGRLDGAVARVVAKRHGGASPLLEALDTVLRPA